MESVFIALAFLVIPPLVFVLGCFVQAALCGYIRNHWSVPAAGTFLTTGGLFAYLSGLSPLVVHGIFLAGVIAVGLLRIRHVGLSLPWRTLFGYSAFSWFCIMFLGATDFISFGGDWIEHGFRYPMTLSAHALLPTIRSCVLGLVYSDVYTVFSPDYSRYYLIQILAASFNAGILFVFLHLLRKSHGNRFLLSACILCCPFVVYEVAYIWPKFFAIAIAYPATQLLYSRNRGWRTILVGMVMSLFSVAVHPLAMFVLLTLPFFSEDRMKMSTAFVGRLVSCLVVCVIGPPLIMKAVGIEIMSTIAYYPFSDNWKDALAAIREGKEVIPYAQAYFKRVGVVGAIGSRVVSLFNMFVPIAGVGRFAFWQNLLFAMGPIGWFMGLLYISTGMGTGEENGSCSSVDKNNGRWILRAGEMVRVLGFAFAPVIVGLVFSTGYMVLQVAGGHWLVVVLAVYAVRYILRQDLASLKSMFILSVLWNGAFTAVSVFSIKSKAPDWAPGLVPGLDSLGRMVDGFSHNTPIYFSDFCAVNVAIGFYLLSALLVSLVVLRGDFAHSASFTCRRINHEEH